MEGEGCVPRLPRLQALPAAGGTCGFHVDGCDPGLPSSGDGVRAACSCRVLAPRQRSGWGWDGSFLK